MSDPAEKAEEDVNDRADEESAAESGRVGEEEGDEDD